MIRSALTVAMVAGCRFSPGGAPRDAPPDATADAPADALPVGAACTGSEQCEAGICDGVSCRLPHTCGELHGAHPTLGDGAYMLDGGTTLFCDMTVDGGGWTLVGKVDSEQLMSATWLVSAVDVEALRTPVIAPATYACIDAVDLAVNASTEIRLTNSDRTRWVSWPLPAGRDIATWWRHSVGHTVVAAAVQVPVSVTTSEGATLPCFQNSYGMLPHPSHGGSYPYTSYNTSGSTLPVDSCMAVGVTPAPLTVDGFDQNGNGYDAPSDETTWPNPAYHISPHVAVWLR